MAMLFEERRKKEVARRNATRNIHHSVSYPLSKYAFHFDCYASGLDATRNASWAHRGLLRIIDYSLDRQE